MGERSNQRDRTDQELLLGLFDRGLTDARVEFILPDRTVTVGHGGTSEAPAVSLRVRDREFFRRILSDGNLGLAETYMHEGWTLEHGSLEDLLCILLRNHLDEKVRLEPLTVARMMVLRARQALLGTRANVQAHYDIGDDLYDIFLDPTRGYTCGYQRNPDDSSQQLQENKYERICQKLRLQPGETLFDVGCGFGGLMIHAAQHHGVRARGITNSRLHAAFAHQRAAALGLKDRVHVDFGDLREATGRYDKVVTCGVLEHLLPHEHRAFMKTLSRLLQPDGFGLVHTIGCVTATNQHDPFIQKYIFPGSTQNPLSVIVGHLERHKLYVLDVENIARHYLPTVRRWLEAYRANRHVLDPVKYNAAFQRMWEYYLCTCIAGSSLSEGAVWQVLFTRNYRRPLPLLRV